jgi:hypothetical protein
MGNGTLDIGFLGSFVATLAQQNDFSTVKGVINSATRSKVDSQLPNTLINWLTITKQSQMKPLNTGSNSSPSLDLR